MFSHLFEIHEFHADGFNSGQKKAHPFEIHEYHAKGGKSRQNMPRDNSGQKPHLFEIHDYHAKRGMSRPFRPREVTLGKKNSTCLKFRSIMPREATLKLILTDGHNIEEMDKTFLGTVYRSLEG